MQINTAVDRNKTSNGQVVRLISPVDDERKGFVKEPYNRFTIKDWKSEEDESVDSKDCDDDEHVMEGESEGDSLCRGSQLRWTFRHWCYTKRIIRKSVIFPIFGSTL